MNAHDLNLVLVGAMRGYTQACEFIASEFNLDLYPDLGDETPPVAGGVLPSFAAGPSRSAGPSPRDGSHATAPGLGEADPTPDTSASESNTKAIHQGMLLALRALAEEFDALGMSEASALATTRAEGLKRSSFRAYS